MQVTVMGKRYALIHTEDGIDDDADGMCDHPVMFGKAIRVRKTLTGKRRLEVEIHEMLHAADWSKCEEWVEQTALDVSTVLWRLGYRIEE